MHIYILYNNIQQVSRNILCLQLFVGLRYITRRECEKCIVFQDMSYFDDPRHNTGALCTRLAVDASAVQGVNSFSFHNHGSLWSSNI